MVPGIFRQPWPHLPTVSEAGAAVRETDPGGCGQPTEPLGRAGNGPLKPLTLSLCDAPPHSVLSPLLSPPPAPPFKPPEPLP